MATVDAALAPGRLRRWVLAARPRTLPLALAPVAVGSAVAFGEGRARALPAAAAAAVALLLQLGANFANDLFDHERGADTPERLGPPRATALGLLSPSAMRAATGLAFAASALPGLYLVSLGGWPIALAGVLAVAAGLAYTGGPWPYGYHGLGEPAVFAFFGVVAVAGTHFVQAGSVSGLALAASLPVGALATAVLVVNNLRDLETDRRAGKRTLAVRLGAHGARLEHAGLVLGAFAVPPALWLTGTTTAAVLAPGLLLPPALGLVREVRSGAAGRALNGVLARTAGLALGFGLLFAVGLAA